MGCLISRMDSLSGPSSIQPIFISKVLMHVQLNQVTEFHQHIHATVAEKPQLLPGSTETAGILAKDLRDVITRLDGREGGELVQRCAMAIEELAEWLEAHVEGNLVSAGDAWADRCYVLLGDAVATGLPAEKLFNAVHVSNMTKCSANSTTGKGNKVASYEPPDITGCLSE